MKRYLLHGCGIALVLTLSGGPAVSQQQFDRGDRDDQSYSRDSHQDARNNRRQRSSQQGNQDRDRRQTRDQQSRNSRSRRNSTYAVPTGWVTIATDVDQDGQYDDTETIYYYDLVQARRSSEQRRQNQRQNGRQNSWRGEDRQQEDRQQTVQIRGTVEDTHTLKLRDGQGESQAHVFARIDTNDGDTQKVCLGPQSKIRQLDLQEGDDVVVKGERHRVNNRPILMAKQVKANGQTVSIKRLQSDGAQRVRGQIESLERRSFRGRDGQFLVAEVDLQSGRTATINLGPSDRLQSLDLGEGDDIRALVREGRINDRFALIATEVHANGETVQIPKSRRASGGGENDRTASSR